VAVVVAVNIPNILPKTRPKFVRVFLCFINCFQPALPFVKLVSICLRENG
jgi:hypothetical protein